MVKVSAWVAVGSVTLSAAMLAFLWLRPQGTVPTVSAKEAVEAACNKMANVNHYDMAATVKHTTNGVQEAESFTKAARVSGADWIAKWTASSDGATGQLARVEGKGYMRDSIDGRGWVYFPGELPHLNSQFSDLGATLACPSLDKVTLYDTETTDDGARLKRYTSGAGADGLADAYENPGRQQAVQCSLFLGE